TRNDILRRDFEDITRQDDCLVYTGVIEDPYTGEIINFTRGRGTSNAVQIDHIVALSNAWKTGAPAWSQDKRVAFANDPLNLVAVDGPTNASKGDDSADWWLPPRRQVWCWYVAIQVSVKSEYGLWVTPDEKVAMKQVLTGCPTQRAWTTDFPERVESGDLNTR
ncbi:MAG: HNH endonuclease family protein, partial [Microbacteriaceae bacterium]